ncbi:MAG: RnfABCDGE type electron transport complex subunit D [Candidatus Neomarinimicrobiota bacterium]
MSVENSKPETTRPKAAAEDKAKESTPSPRLLILSSSPHQFGPQSVPKIMWSVVGALIPAALMAIFYFGMRALWMMLVCVLAALVTEALINRLRGIAFTIKDGSAIITGLLLALTPAACFSLQLWSDRGGVCHCHREADLWRPGI